MIKKRLAKIFRETLTRISPKLNTYVLYRVKFHRRLNLKNPRTLNEKILWLKFNTYWENVNVKKCADKFEVREYIKEIGCEEILNDLIAVYEKVDDIEWEFLPQQFVIKLNVGCGCNLIIQNKSEYSFLEVKKKIKKWMKIKHYLGYSEMQYKGVKPYILVENYLKNNDGRKIDDYKFYCFNGSAPYVMVCVARDDLGHNAKFFYFNRDWQMQMMSEDAIKYGATTEIPKPINIDKAFDYAEKISKGFPFVRVDLYLVNGKVYFGEMTFTPGGAMDQGRLIETDKMLGEMLNLENEVK